MDGYNKSITNTNHVRETWSYGWGDSYGCGLSWPPKSYTCSFCKREFRSAQALGGHMNVHRRDRARLRGSPPWELQHEPNPNPNPSPNPNPDGTTTRQICLPNLNHVPQVHVCDASFSPLESFPHTTTPTYPLPPFSPSPSFVSNAKPSYYCGATENPKPRKAMKALFGVADVEEMEGKEGHLLRRRDVVRLDLKIGIHDDELDENLDLELRLGYA